MSAASTKELTSTRVASRCLQTAQASARLQRDILRVLDESYRLLDQARVFEGLDLLLIELQHLRNSSPREIWTELAGSFALDHPLVRLLHTVPFTGRAFAKPRGYAGDAVMMDYIYGDRSSEAEIGSLEREIQDWELQSSACRAVRERREILAARLASVGTLESPASVLSVACGHLREAFVAPASTSDQRCIETIYALDQDEASLDFLRAQKHPGIEPIHGSVRDIMLGRVKLEGLSLIYSAGLFDYLQNREAAFLLRRLLAMLAPGGRLLVGNFAPSLPGIAYMELIMDWHLVYRSELDMRALATGLPRGEVSVIDLFRDSTRSVVYLELQRSATATQASRPQDTLPAMTSVT